MKRILCYGDSNTWGTIPDGSCRHCDLNDAYPTILQRLLSKEEFTVICEGMPSRTTNQDDIKFPKGNRNGLLFYPQCVVSHDPLDYIVLFLGSNDLKAKFNRNTEDIVKTLENDYIKFTKEQLASELTKTPKFIVICPSIVEEGKFEGFEGAYEKSAKFDSEYSQMAQNNDCLYVSNEGFVCGDDGIHLVKETHELIANRLYRLIKNDLKES